MIDGAPDAPWCTGRAEYEIDYRQDRLQLIVAARCRLGEDDATHLALLDTGATWTMIPEPVANTVSDSLEDTGLDETLSTRLGNCRGRLYRLTVTIVADEGHDLATNATVLVSADWPGPVVLGYKGLMEKMRVALDPGIDAHSVPTFYFGV